MDGRYQFEQRCGDSSTYYAILEKVTVDAGTIYATKVADLDNYGQYKACLPVEFVAGGGAWTMTRFEGELV